LKVLPNLMEMDPKKYPILSATYTAVIQKVDFDKIAEELQASLQRF
jgi:hypothetical protein